MTPAEKLAQQKQATKTPVAMGKPRYVKKFPWKCTVKLHRRALNLTQTEVASQIGISPSGLSVIEKGADIAVSTAKSIATFFGRPIDDLWPAMKDE